MDQELEGSIPHPWMGRAFLLFCLPQKLPSGQPNGDGWMHVSRVKGPILEDQWEVSEKPGGLKFKLRRKI